MKITGKLWIGLVILALLSPLGLILPALFNADGAWGEWSAEELKKLIGFVPAGMERLFPIWDAPLPNYAVPGQGAGGVHQGLGYVLTALIGLAVTAGFAYLVARIFGRKDH
jgi:cobalt/nickel transport protein